MPTGILLNVTGGVVKSLPHDLTAWHKVLRRLQNSGRDCKSSKNNVSNCTLTAVFLGGSMASGIMSNQFMKLSNCSSQCLSADPKARTRCPSCAYPALFGKWLQAAYPSLHVHIHNLAIGGSVSKGALTILGPKLDAIKTKIDVVFLHYVNNDGLDAIHHENSTSMGYEDLIRHLLSIDAAVIDLPMHVSFLPKEHQPIQGVLRTHQVVTSYYKVPVLAIEHDNQRFYERSLPFRDPPAILPWLMNDTFCANKLNYIQSWVLESHPPWIYHQVIANFLRYAWKFQSDAACLNGASLTSNESGKLPPWMPEFNRTDLTAHCLSTHSSVTPDLIQNASISIDSGNWVFGEDKKGNNKKGWWINNSAGGAITFTITAKRTNAVVILSYLTSYSNDMGKVEVFVDGFDKDILIIDSFRENRRVSLQELTRLCLPKVSKYSFLPHCDALKTATNKEGNEFNGITNHNVTIKLLPRQGQNKFKILGLFSC
mmetsp:Transcript_4017/g.5624  ORF Transcript_4017/g.5624 Transcript_4017/m.5624 type:complete len:484 (+) Transcript_4017:1577-3028(+)